MKNFYNIDGIKIPLDCPKCTGKMIATRYEPSIKVLRDRSWQLCNSCGFQRSSEQFKEELFTI